MAEMNNVVLLLTDNINPMVASLGSKVSKGTGGAFYKKGVRKRPPNSPL